MNLDEIHQETAKIEDTIKKEIDSFYQSSCYSLKIHLHLSKPYIEFKHKDKSLILEKDGVIANQIEDKEMVKVFIKIGSKYL